MTALPPTTAATEDPEPNSAADAPGVAIYSVCDARFFLGLVALVNSLRVHGHRERIYVVDCGLTGAQRETLSDEATILKAPADLAPQLLKYAGPAQAPADVMVLVDADIIVTRPLDPLVEAALDGKIVAFTDTLEDRFYDSWSELLGLGHLRRQPYVNSGFLVLPRARGLELLEQLEQHQRRIDVSETILEGGPPGNPFYFPDQDVLNALLASTFRADELMIMSGLFAPHPPFAGVSVIDARDVRCAYTDGETPYALHHVLHQKPWLAATKPTPYSELLPRLWLGSDVAVKPDPRDVPLRFRSGRLAAVDRRRAELVVRLHAARGQLGLRRYLRNRRKGRGQAGLEADGA